ncbi:MAG: DUF2523 domain-containing protein [Ramlibacter sp.]
MGGLINIAGTLAGRVLISLGFAAVSYVGFSASLTWLKSQAVTAVLGLPPEVVAMLSTMKVGQSISIIFSAILARQVLNGLTGDTIKRLVQR